MLPHSLLWTLALAPSLVSAALFPKNTQVKSINAKGFRTAMKENKTAVVAFVAQWCGHCKAMGPEYSKAALGLYPLIPFYAVDCDENRALCAEQGVKGFPTVKLFPRGKEVAPVTYDQDRSASAIYYWAMRRVPNDNKKLPYSHQLEPWIKEHIDRDRVLLLSKQKGVPLLWQVLANEYRDHFAFANHRDRRGLTSIELGLEPGTRDESKIFVYPKGSTKPTLFEGVLKHETISKFFNSIIDGTADLNVEKKVITAEDSPMTEEEEEIERQQEAERIALLHGGFNDLIDFEEAIKKHGKDFHGSHGYGNSLGGMPLKKKPAESTTDSETAAAPEAEEKADGRKEEVKSGDGEQVVFEVRSEASATETMTPASETPAGTETEPAPVLSEEEPAIPPAPEDQASPAEEPAPTPSTETDSEHVKDEL